MNTRRAFLEDAYLSAFEAEIVSIGEHSVGCSGIALNATNFHANRDGQPGDTGYLELANGSQINVTDTLYSKDKKTIIHQVEGDSTALKAGERIVCHIDWERRYKLMRMHSACHLLSAACHFPIIYSNIDENESHVGFDLQGTKIVREEITDKMMAMVNANHPIFTRWIGEDERVNNSKIVKTKNVNQLTDLGGNCDIRLVCIGKKDIIDRRVCDGTHVSETKEIGDIYIDKIENKGKENWHFSIQFGRL